MVQSLIVYNRMIDSLLQKDHEETQMKEIRIDYFQSLIPKMEESLET